MTFSRPTILASRTSAHLASVGQTTGAAAQHAQLLAFHDAFFAAAALGVVGLAFAFLVHDEDAAATMRRPAPVAAEEALEAARIP